MFGVVHACRQTLDDELLQQWQAHLCGLCLSLRDSRGQLSRALTNTDAVLLSVLVEAQQTGAAARATAGPCPLRGMRTAQVVPAQAVAARLGATASVTLAAAKAGDVRAEREHLLITPTVRTRAVAALAGPLRRSALLDTEMADAVRATDLFEDDLAGQAALESAVQVGDPLLAVTAPTARAAGRIFASSAVLTGRPENEEPLRDIGEAFGALAHLLDAVEDLPADQRSGAFNPIQATGGSIGDARRLAHQLVRRIRSGFDRLQLHDGRLARALLVDGTRAAVHRTFAPEGAGSCQAAPSGSHLGYPGPPPGPAGTPPPQVPTAPGQIPPIPPPPPKEPPKPPFWPSVLPWIGVYCTGYACCATHQNPCTGKQHSAGCSGCDGSCCECGDCCDCCDGDCCCDCNC